MRSTVDYVDKNKAPVMQWSENKHMFTYDTMLCNELECRDIYVWSAEVVLMAYEPRVFRGRTERYVYGHLLRRLGLN